MNLDVYKIELQCNYKSEVYHVRDNGAVMRLPNDKVRPLDNVWAYGSKINDKGYFQIGHDLVHRIVATAFHGPAPTDQHVVDHIDTNKQNNRPENLRWLTKLENILMNPITVKRIEIATGVSVYEFLKEPKKYKDKFEKQNLSWMCNVSPEEAQISRERLLEWANSDYTHSGGKLGKWIYKKPIQPVVNYDYEYIDPCVESLTPFALQENWVTPVIFHHIPEERTIEAYYNKLKESADIEGAIYTSNKYGYTLLIDVKISDCRKFIYVLSRNHSGWLTHVNEIRLNDDNCFVHKSLTAGMILNGVLDGKSGLYADVLLYYLQKIEIYTNDD